MSESKLIFVGLIITPVNLKAVSVNSGYVVVEKGKITKIGTIEQFEDLEKAGLFSDFEIIKLSDDQLLIPGFVDCHTHAPQFPNIGVGLDRPLLEWLNKYTFPLESHYEDVHFATRIYDKVVKRLLNNGTTTACYFGSLHLDGTMELVKSVIRNHQRALVGKVSMNVRNDAGYFNETKKELEDVETFVVDVLSCTNGLVQPIITPRFALSCDEELMIGLSSISRKHDCGIQSHISENCEEIRQVLKTFPSCDSYAEVYNKCQILNSKCIMAHAIHLTDAEIELLSKKGVSFAHCPASNTRLRSGLCPVRKYLNKNINVGLGTDVSGGDNASIMDTIRRTIDVSTHLELQGNKGSTIEWTEAFYMATLGGAKALNLADKTGSLEVGKEFDALLVDVYRGAVDRYEYQRIDSDDSDYTNLLEKFIYLGDDRNIVQVYVSGQKVKDIL